MPFVRDLSKRLVLANPQIEAELVAAVYQALPLGLFSAMLVATVLGALLVQVVPLQDVFLWWWVTLLVTISRAIPVWGFRRASLRDRRRRRWRWFVIAGYVASGLLWGAVGWWLWPVESALHQALIIMLVGGMVSGAITTLASLLSPYIWFNLLATVPLALRYVAEGGLVSYQVALVISLFSLVTIVSAWRVNLLVRTNLHAQFGRQQAERELQREAMYDPLTNLPNRRYLLERLQQEFARAKRHDETGALLFLDLDNFKTINDSLGHPIGDRLLQQVAERLQERFRDEDVASRLGGDEFVVLLPELSSSREQALSEAQIVATSLKEILSSSYEVDGHALYVTASIGVVLFPEEADTYQDVLKHADTAMYEAKASGRNGFRFFSPDMKEAVSHRLLIEKDLRRALESGQLSMHYQPQVDAAGHIVGLEALARWQHDEYGDISPADFVPIADDSMLVFVLHEWVVERVCQDMRTLIDSGVGEAVPLVSINVSARAFHNDAFEKHLLDVVAKQRIPGDRLCLEVTETSLMQQVDLAVPKMQALREAGLLFSIDDFGTGYSSLSYLKKLPVDSLKIDKSFVRDISTDPDDAAIVEAILSMAGHLELKVIAEGVETEETARFLRQRGCTLFQGYLYGDAVALDRLIPKLCGKP